MAEYINEKAGYYDEKDGAVTVDFVPWRPRTQTYIDGHTLQAVTVEKAWGEYKLNDGKIGEKPLHISRTPLPEY